MAKATEKSVAVLRFGKYAVYKALDEGAISGVRLGNRWMVSRPAFERWLENCGLPAAMNGEWLAGVLQSHGTAVTRGCANRILTRRRSETCDTSSANGCRNIR